MTLIVCSARLSCPDPDRLNVTRGSGNAAGAPFAPSHALLSRYLEKMRIASGIEDDARLHEKTVSAARPDMTGIILQNAKAEAEGLRAVAFAEYAPLYVAEMRESYKKNWSAWRVLLLRERVVVTCYCSDPDRCHRTILRARILTALGATDGGELPPEEQRRRVSSQKGTP
jgi:hypothetical protein